FLTEDTHSSTGGLSRVLGLTDVSAIGISSTLGSGIYVLAGSVIAKYSGPSIVISFIIAGIATFLSGLSYAELGARVPKSGSAYVYIYVTIGEFVAFMMGWDLILEYVIGTASVSNALSQYIDKLTGRKIQAFFRSTMPFNSPFLGPYPDLLAFGLVMIITCFMLVGVKESALMNKIFTVLNITVLSFIIITGATKADFSNWNKNTHQNLSWIDVTGSNQTCQSSGRCGNGGFMPFGINGIITGAAKCFYAFIGFDAIASTGEELKNPKRNIPLGIIITLSVAASLYCGISVVITLMVPYFIIDPDTPLPHAFEYVHYEWAKYFVSFGAILSLCTCLYAGMFPMPRIVYSMASDGLIFQFFGKILPRFKTPYVASIFAGVCAGTFAAIFDLNELVEMMSIGTLIAYTLVSLCVLILRYKPEGDLKEDFKSMNEIDREKVTSSLLNESESNFLRRLFYPSNNHANSYSSFLVNFLTIITLFHLILLSIVLSNAENYGKSTIGIAIILLFNIVLFSLIIWRQPQNKNIKTFKTPFAPFIPILSSFINIYLMTTLSLATWLRFFIWFVIGLVVYFIYGASHSKENKRRHLQRWFIPFILKQHKVDDIDEKIESKSQNNEMTKF
ncbi:unnamed protein product, partial [Brachionus calyciflorus]